MATNRATWNSADHDLLIKLNTLVEAVREDIRTMNNGVQASLVDHETRIRSLERQRWLIVGGAAAVAAVIGWFTNFFGHGI